MHHQVKAHGPFMLL